MGELFAQRALETGSKDMDAFNHKLKKLNSNPLEQQKKEVTGSSRCSHSGVGRSFSGPSQHTHLRGGSSQLVLLRPRNPTGKRKYIISLGQKKVPGWSHVGLTWVVCQTPGPERVDMEQTSPMTEQEGAYFIP